MDKVEIRPNRKYLLPFTGVLILGLLFENYIVFFTDYYKGRDIWKLVSIVLSVYLAVAIYKVYKLIRINAAAIIMSQSNFTYNKKGTYISYQWSDISGWNILREDNSNWLIIEIFGNQEKIDINWLDKSPDQIMALIQRFKLKKGAAEQELLDDEN